MIGNDAKDQLDKFQRAEYADPKSRHFVFVDQLERAKIDYSVRTRRFLRHADGTLHDPYAAEFWRPGPNGKQLCVPENYTEVKIPLNEIVSFRDWATNGISAIAEGQEPDSYGKNESGWVRVNAIGEVMIGLKSLPPTAMSVPPEKVILISMACEIRSIKPLRIGGIVR